MKINKKFDSYTCFGSLDWNHDWERQQELIFRMAQSIDSEVYNFKPLGLINYNPFSICFYRKLFKKFSAKIESIKNPRPNNLTTIGGFTIPFHNKFFGYINYKLLKCRFPFSSENNFFWGTYPNYTVYEFFKRSKFRVYDIAERRSKNSNIPDYAKKLEKRMIIEADIVFIDNHAAINDYKNLNPNIHYVPQGVNIEMFNVANDYSSREYIGYIGNLHFAIDYPFLKKLIISNSNKKFLIVGSILESSALDIISLPNVTYVDKVQKSELPIFLEKMKFGLIPYLINDVTVGIYPTKLFEYIAANVPVISTPLPEVLQYADDDYLKIINSSTDLNFEFPMKKKDEILKDNTWNRRWEIYIMEINNLLNNNLD